MITYYAGDRLVGLSSDIKPLDIANGATFAETDTLNNFIKVDGAWTEYAGDDPQGGVIDVAVTNYWATLYAHFMSLDTGLTTAQIINLPNSLVEPINLSARTFLYARYSSILNAQSDNIFGREGALNEYLPGYINPAYLRYSGHFNGSGMFPKDGNKISSDKPVWNSNSSDAKFFTHDLSYIESLFPTDQFTGGVATGFGVFSGAPANAFDGNWTSTFCGFANQLNPWLKYDLGAGNEKILKSFAFKFSYNLQLALPIVIQGSNDDATWDALSTDSYFPWFLGSGNPHTYGVNVTNVTAYRYYRMYISLPSSQTTTIYEWAGYTQSYISPYYDTTTKKFGASSLYLPASSYVQGTYDSIVYAQLADRDWQMRGFFKFDSIPVVMPLMTILGGVGTSGKQLEILATADGLRVNYSTNGTTFTTVNSSTVAWGTAAFHYVSVRRVGNTLYFYVDGVAYGTADMTGVSLAINQSSSRYFYIGTDTAKTITFSGNIDELEFLVSSTTDDTEPVAERSTAYLPALTWISNPTYIPTTAKGLYISLLLDEVKHVDMGVPTVNTDLVISISTDNGLTWDAITLAKGGNVTTAVSSYFGSSDVTLLDNTNQLCYKIANAQGKVVKVDGIILYWF